MFNIVIAGVGLAIVLMLGAAAGVQLLLRLFAKRIEARERAREKLPPISEAALVFQSLPLQRRRQIAEAYTLRQKDSGHFEPARDAA